MDICDWNELKGRLPEETLWLIPHEDEQTFSLSNVLSGLTSEYPLAILIGPEGGFSAEEIELARTKLKATTVSLGPRILRTETAALAALTMVLTNFGDLG